MFVLKLSGVDFWLKRTQPHRQIMNQILHARFGWFKCKKNPWNRFQAQRHFWTSFNRENETLFGKYVNPMRQHPFETGLASPQVFPWSHLQHVLEHYQFIGRIARLQWTNSGEHAFKEPYIHCIKVSVYHMIIWDKFKVQHPHEIPPRTQHDLLFNPSSFDSRFWSLVGTKLLISLIPSTKIYSVFIPSYYATQKVGHLEDFPAVIFKCSHVVVPGLCSVSEEPFGRPAYECVDSWCFMQNQVQWERLC